MLTLYYQYFLLKWDYLAAYFICQLLSFSFCYLKIMGLVMSEWFKVTEQELEKDNFMNLILYYQYLLCYFSSANHAAIYLFLSMLLYHSQHYSYSICLAHMLDLMHLFLLVFLQNMLFDHLCTQSLNQFYLICLLMQIINQDNHFSVEFRHFFHQLFLFFRHPSKLILSNLHKLFVNLDLLKCLEKLDHLAIKNSH